jgi:hypothetical protein
MRYFTDPQLKFGPIPAYLWPRLNLGGIATIRADTSTEGERKESERIDLALELAPEIIQLSQTGIVSISYYLQARSLTDDPRIILNRVRLGASFDEALSAGLDSLTDTEIPKLEHYPRVTRLPWQR